MICSEGKNERKNLQETIGEIPLISINLYLFYSLIISISSNSNITTFSLTIKLIYYLVRSIPYEQKQAKVEFKCFYLLFCCC